MNKTWKTILKILGYVISFLLTKDKGQKTKAIRVIREIRVQKSWKTHGLKSLSMLVRCCSL